MSNGPLDLSYPPDGTFGHDVADGADVNAGAKADAAVTGDTSGSLSAKLRGLNKIFASVWDSANGWLKTSWASKLDILNDAVSTYPSAYTAVNLTVSGQILNGAGVVEGFIVNSTSSGTIRVADNTAAGSGYTGGVMTPTAGVFQRYPAKLSTGGYVTITGTIDVTFFVRLGAQA